MVPFRRREPLPDEYDFPFRRRYARLRLLLEGVQHVNSVAETHGIDGPEGVAFKRRYDLKHGAPPKTLERLDGGVFFAALSRVKSLPHDALHRPGEGLRSLLEVPTQRSGLGAFSIIQVYVFMDAAWR